MQNTETVLSEIKKQEQNLCDFYLEAKKKILHPVCQKVFATLSKEHQKHLERIKEILSHAKKGKSWLVDRWLWDVGQGISNPLTQMSEFLEMPLCTTEELKWLNLAMEKEEDFFNFLDEQVRKSSQSLIKRFYLSLAYEARGYYLLLLDTKDCITHPDYWQQPLQPVLVDGI